jgi:hypothetical protein
MEIIIAIRQIAPMSVLMRMPMDSTANEKITQSSVITPNATANNFCL